MKTDDFASETLKWDTFFNTIGYNEANRTILIGVKTQIFIGKWKASRRGRRRHAEGGEEGKQKKEKEVYEKSVKRRKKLK